MLCYGYEYQEGSRPDSSAIHLASSSHIWSLLAEKVKVGQLLQEDISGHYFTQFISKVDQKLNQVKLESVRTLLQITYLTSRKAYLVIICLNSYEKLTKIKIRSSWSRFEHC